MSTIAERLSEVDTKLNNILTNANTALTNKGKTAVSDLSDLPSAVAELKNPTGTISITENGTVDVSQYASANVNIPIQKYYTGSTEPSSSLGNDGDLYLQTS